MKWIKLFEDFNMINKSFINDDYVDEIIELDGDYLLSEYQMEYYDNDNEIDVESDEFKIWVKSFLFRRLEDIEYKIKSNFKKGYITIWRAIKVNKKWFDNIKPFDTVGIYWAYEKNSADDYSSENIDDGVKIILKTLVDKSKIDWDETILCNMNLLVGDAESEIRLKKGVEVQIVDIESPNNLDINKIKNITLLA